MIVSRRMMMALATAFSIALAQPSGAFAKIVSLEEAMKDLVYGSADAKVEVVEYASLACPACLYFHDNIFPVIKAEYIDTGKVRFIYHDFPTNTAALAASMVARCAGPERHGAMNDIFFSTQKQWSHSENPMQAIGMVARMAGLGPTEVDACIKNSKLMNAIQDGAKKANAELGVNSTPTVFIAGKLLEHTMDIGKVRAAIDEALKAAK